MNLRCQRVNTGSWLDGILTPFLSGVLNLCVNLQTQHILIEQVRWQQKTRVCSRSILLYSLVIMCRVSGLFYTLLICFVSFISINIIVNLLNGRKYKIERVDI